MAFSGVYVSTDSSWHGTYYYNDGPSQAPSITGVSSASGELVLDMFGIANDEGATPHAEQTLVRVAEQGAVTNGASTEPGAASVDMSWSGVNDKWTLIAVPLKQATLSAATFAELEDVKLIGLAKETPQRLRFLVSNEDTGSSGAVSYQLHVAETTDPTGADCATETYLAVQDASETHWEIVGSIHITEPEATEDIASGLTNEATTFVAGELKDAGDTIGSITLASDQFTEIEFSIQATTGAADAGEYCFKLVQDGSPDEDLDTYSLYAQVNLAGATAVRLLSFTATGEGEAVKVSWQTAHEINNMGFYVYRADAKNGPFIRLNEKLIPGSDFATLGKQYSYIDKDVSRGRLYYYRLVDVDTAGTWTYHGPICVDWDGDGMPDDWEIANGLDPTTDDSWVDSDNDGLTNLEEHERGTDPNNPDSDGDGILDGDEYFDPARDGSNGSRSLTRGVQVLASDETGVTLELRTETFEAESVYVGAAEFERLRIKEYVHGYTTQVGKPQLPLKGMLVDIPAGKQASLTLLKKIGQIHSGYQVYPVPENFADEQQDTVKVAELFAMDQHAYSEDAFYPNAVAELGESYFFRDQQKQQVIFYPLSFNPVSGKLSHYTRIRVRIDYVDGDIARTRGLSPQPWSPDTKTGLVARLTDIGQ